MTVQTHIIAIPSLSALIDEFSSILEDPVKHGVAQTEAQASVLSHVRAAFVNQDQIPIPTDTSAARGAFFALSSAAEQASLLNATVEGDVRPHDNVRLKLEKDERGRLNPLRLFDEDVEAGLYPFISIAPALRDHFDQDMVRSVLQQDAIALAFVEDAVDWETWMESFAR